MVTELSPTSVGRPTPDERVKAFVIRTSEGTLSVPCGNVGILTLGDPLAHEVQTILSGKSESDAPMNYRSENWSASQTLLIGAGNENSIDITVIEYLSNAGYRAQELESILDEFDLRKFSSRQVRQLPAIPQRQVELLAACHQNALPLLLVDPFSMFNGRWRERFAEITREFAARSGHAVVALRVSFIPKAWSNAANASEIRIATTRSVAAPKRDSNLGSTRRTAGAAEESVQLQMAESWSTHLATIHGWKSLAERIAQWRNAAGLLGVTMIVAVVGTIGTSMSIETSPQTRRLFAPPSHEDGTMRAPKSLPRHQETNRPESSSTNSSQISYEEPPHSISNAEVSPGETNLSSLAQVEPAAIPAAMEAEWKICTPFGELPHWYTNHPVTRTELQSIERPKD